MTGSSFIPSTSSTDRLGFVGLGRANDGTATGRGVGALLAPALAVAPASGAGLGGTLTRKGGCALTTGGGGGAEVGGADAGAGGGDAA